MQRIDLFKWLTEVLQYLGGSPLQVVTTERQQFKKNDNLFRDTIKTRCRYHDSNSGQWKRITGSDDL